MRSTASWIDQFFACALIAVGVAHLVTGLSILTSVTEGWIWFMGTGVAALAVGALNLARRWHGRDGWALRALCLVVNLILLAVVLAYAATFAERLTWQVVAIPAIVLAASAFALNDALR